MHNWEDPDGIITTYHGKIEEVNNSRNKALDYTICYWGTNESYGGDGQDKEHVPMWNLITDFLLEDLIFLLD